MDTRIRTARRLYDEVFKYIGSKLGNGIKSYETYIRLDKSDTRRRKFDSEIRNNLPISKSKDDEFKKRINALNGELPKSSKIEKPEDFFNLKEILYESKKEETKPVIVPTSEVREESDKDDRDKIEDEELEEELDESNMPFWSRLKRKINKISPAVRLIFIIYAFLIVLTLVVASQVALPVASLIGLFSILPGGILLTAGIKRLLNPNPKNKKISGRTRNKLKSKLKSLAEKIKSKIKSKDRQLLPSELDMVREAIPSDIEEEPEISEEENEFEDEEPEINEEENEFEDEESEIDDEENEFEDEESEINDEENEFTDEDEEVFDEREKHSEEEHEVTPSFVPRGKHWNGKVTEGNPNYIAKHAKNGPSASELRELRKEFLKNKDYETAEKISQAIEYKHQIFENKTEINQRLRELEAKKESLVAQKQVIEENNRTDEKSK